MAMKAEAFTYDLHESVDLAKLAKSLDYLKFADERGKVLITQVGGLTLTLFESGKIRVFSPGKSFDEIRDKMLTASVEIYSVIEDISKTMKLGLNSKNIISSGYREDVGFAEKSLRGALPSDVSMEIMRHIFFGIYDVAGDFQVERIASKAGETMGRDYIRAKKPTKKPELISSLKSLFKETKLGEIEEIKPERSSATIECALRLHNSAFSAGIPNINAKVDNFARGVIRGAFVEFKKMESISVNETKCWGEGDTYCEFEVYSLAR